MSINAVKGVEIGSGFKSASSTGSENNDEIFPDNDGGYIFNSNNAGGILGGISTGQPIVANFAVKPTSSILIEKNSVDIENQKTKIITKGRHDPCVCLLYTSDAADDSQCVDLGGRRIIKKIFFSSRRRHTRSD